MRQRRMLVPVSVGFAWRIKLRVVVLVMLIVKMEMFMFNGLVNVPMFVAFGHMEPDTGEHERSSRTECPVEPALTEGERKRRACKWSSGKIRSRARCAKMPKCLHEENETNAIAEKTDSCDAKGDVRGGKSCADGECQA